MKKITTIQETINISLNHDGENEYFPCDLKLKEDKKIYKAYEVSICNRDLLFFTNKGTLNYVVDTIGFNHSLNLVSIDDEE